MTKLISTLKTSIGKYKEEYAQLISQAEANKTSLRTVQDKVDRSMSLLKSLGIEKMLKTMILFSTPSSRGSSERPVDV